MALARIRLITPLVNRNPSFRPSIISQTIRINHTETATSAAAATQVNSHHKHDKLWAAERYLSLGLLGILPIASLVDNQALDYAVALSLMLHVHWGLEAIVVDYVRPSIFGPVVPKVALGLLYLLSSAALGGLFMFNYTDIGISNAVRMVARM